MDHRALLTLNEVAGTGRTVRLSGAMEIVRRLWDLLDLASPALELC